MADSDDVAVVVVGETTLASQPDPGLGVLAAGDAATVTSLRSLVCKSAAVDSTGMGLRTNETRG